MGEMMVSGAGLLYVAIGILVGFYLPKVAYGCLCYRFRQLEMEEKPKVRSGRRSQIISMSLAGLASYIAYLTFESQWERMIALLFIWFLLLVSWTDLFAGLILDLLSYPGLALFFLLRLLSDETTILSYVWTALLIGSGSFLISWLSKGLGLGDVKLLIVGSLVAGWPEALLAVWIATWSASLYWVYLWLKRSRPLRRTMIYFAPHLSLGFFISYVWGERILATYFSWFWFALVT